MRRAERRDSAAAQTSGQPEFRDAIADAEDRRERSRRLLRGAILGICGGRSGLRLAIGRRHHSSRLVIACRL